VFKKKKRLDEQRDWNEVRRNLSAYFSEAELRRIGRLEGDSLDMVELVMAVEERQKTR
jgi:acyl carrier protein